MDGSPGRPLRVGLQLPEVEYTPSWSQVRDIATLAEDIGLDSLWIGDHYLYRDERGSRGPWEAWTQLAIDRAHTLTEGTGRALGPVLPSKSGR